MDSIGNGATVCTDDTSALRGKNLGKPPKTVKTSNSAWFEASSSRKSICEVF